MSASQILIMPKFVTISSNAALPKIRPAPSESPVSSGYDSSTGSSANAADNCSPPKGKKRRLDHLTWEEKVQRKKLKNRVAAQTSRDRKKARMEEMDYEIQSLTEKTDLLQNKCESLQAINDSLLEKNQKLDMEVELLRQQLADLQQQQQENATKSNSRTVGTCAGSGLNPNGLTVDTRTTAKEQHNGGPLEDCCPLPTLQDMLLLDEEFDASKLEELAESLLADITADMETSDRKSNEIVTQVTSGTERLSGSMVGTTAECLESSEHSSRNSCLNTPEIVTTDILQNELQSIETQSQTNTQIASAQTQSLTINSITSDNVDADAKMNVCRNDAYETVYGTYDAKTNSITIVMDDDTEAVNEAVEEIYCDGVTPPLGDEDYIKCTSPSQVYLNVDCPSDDENDNYIEADDDLNFDPIEKFLRPKRPLITPLAKSPANSVYSATSDHGYESVIGSPEIPSSERYQSSTIGDDIDDFDWNSSFTELFPTLI